MGSVSLSADGERVEVELLERLLHEPALVLSVEGLARELLGRLHGELGDLAPDLRARPPRLDLDLAPGPLETLLTLGLDVLARSVLEARSGLLRTGEDLLGVL